MMKYFTLSALVASTFAAPEFENHQTIRQIAEKVQNDPSITWKSGSNSKFDFDRPAADYSYLMGTLETPEHLKLAEKHIVPKVGSEIPTEFDPRVQWPNCPSLNEIRDQGTCGSCWAFGAASAFTDRACIQTNAMITFDISSQDILSCCRTCGMGCNGGYLGPTWSYMASKGVCSGGLYEGTGCKPYSIAPCEHHTTGDRPDCADLPDSPTPACENTCVDNYSGPSYMNDKTYGADSYSVGNARNLDKIQTELMENGPLEVAFTVYEDFMSYTGGVYYHTSGKSLGGHAIKLMGWGVDSETGMDYWLLANSWNSDWGENGFFRMRRGTNECGLENSAVGGMIAV